MTGIFLAARSTNAWIRGSLGVLYAAVPSGKAYGGDAWLYGLQQDDHNRTNIGLVNDGSVGSESDAFEIENFDGETGQELDTIRDSTPKAHSWDRLGQYSRALQCTHLELYLAHDVFQWRGSRPIGANLRRGRHRRRHLSFPRKVANWAEPSWREA